MKSFKGKEVDVSQLIRNSGNVMAVGNMKVNARGDLLGRNGKIIKTREQLENEYVAKLDNGAKIKQENPKGFNQGLAHFIDSVAEKAHSEDVKTDDPFKKTQTQDVNLSTDKDKTVKFSDIVKKEESTETQLDDLPLDDISMDDEFEISDDATPKTSRNSRKK